MVSSQEIVFVWRDIWRRHETRLIPDKDLSSEDVERLVVNDLGLYSRGFNVFSTQWVPVDSQYPLPN